MWISSPVRLPIQFKKEKWRSAGSVASLVALEAHPVCERSFVPQNVPDGQGYTAVTSGVSTLFIYREHPDAHFDSVLTIN